MLVFTLNSLMASGRSNELSMRLEELSQVKKDDSDSRRRAGVATTCNDLWQTCTNGCGANAVFPCTDRGGNCTPFSFMPNISNQNCAFMDNGFWKTKPLFEPFGDEYSYQAYAAVQPDGTAYDDTWVVHGCNGAGIQPDCIGDALYLEHFDSKVPVQGQNCDLSDKTQEYNVQCPTFNHPGIGATYPGYSCGWWRGYENWGDANAKQAHGDGVGLLGPTDGNDGYTGSYYDEAVAVLEKCPTCSYGTALENPYRSGADSYFVGGVWPWICTAGGSEHVPYTGKEVDCFCDNEPRNGRQPIGGATKPLMPTGMKVVYCGKFGDVLKCDFISVDPVKGESILTNTAVEMYATAFPAQ